VWYALTATTTLACLFIIGHFMLEHHLIRQLDLLNEQQFKQLKTALGPSYNELTPENIEERIRDTTESASSLFYIDMHASMTNRFFKSHNLHGQSVPDIPDQRSFSVDMPEIGTLRASEFLLPPFDVMVATPLAPVYDLLSAYRQLCVALITAMLLLSAAIGFGLSQLVLRPIRAIRETANRIRSDNLKERIPVDVVKDEIAELANLLNQMFDRIETSFDQIRRFTAEASHELKTPLSLVRLHAERLLMDGKLDLAQRDAVLVQLEELARVNHIIEDLLFLSRADAQAIAVDLKPCAPASFLQSFVQDATVLAEHHGRKFSCSHEGEGTVYFEEKRMRQVLLNVLTNALNVSPAGGCIILRSVLSKDTWHLAVEDEGPGLNAEQRNQIFERFVRFGPEASSETGSGLGLAISRSIVNLHKGRIFAVNGAGGRGLRMMIEIPAALRSESFPFA
jgi:two-component system heavy metal sensor histidine kinase CusS